MRLITGARRSRDRRDHRGISKETGSRLFVYNCSVAVSFVEIFRENYRKLLCSVQFFKSSGLIGENLSSAAHSLYIFLSVRCNLYYLREY